MKSLLSFILVCFIAFTGKAQAFKVIGVAEFAEGLKQENVQIVDCRTPAEFNEGFIKGAVLMDWQQQAQFAEAAKKLDKSKPVYVYCLAGVRSGKAADWLSKNGFTKVYSLDGGMKAWKEKEMPVSKE